MQETSFDQQHLLVSPPMEKASIVISPRPMPSLVCQLPHCGPHVLHTGPIRTFSPGSNASAPVSPSFGTKTLINPKEPLVCAPREPPSAPQPLNASLTRYTGSFMSQTFILSLIFFSGVPPVRMGKVAAGQQTKAFPVLLLTKGQGRPPPTPS